MPQKELPPLQGPHEFVDYTHERHTSNPLRELIKQVLISARILESKMRRMDKKRIIFSGQYMEENSEGSSQEVLVFFPDKAGEQRFLKMSDKELLEHLRMIIDLDHNKRNNRHTGFSVVSSSYDREGRPSINADAVSVSELLPDRTAAQIEQKPYIVWGCRLKSDGSWDIHPVTEKRNHGKSSSGKSPIEHIWDEQVVRTVQPINS